MADTKISDMTNVGDIAATDFVPVVRAGANARAAVGTAAATDAIDYATAVQGAKADTALQPDQNLADIDDASVARTNLDLEIGVDVQAHDADLDALAALDATAGILAKTAANAYARRTITGGGGVTVTNGAGTAGNPTLGVSALRTLFIPAAAMRPSTTNGCLSLNQVEIAANQPEIFTLDFDPSTEQYALFQVAMPKGWDEGTISAVIYWSHPATVTNFATVWGVQGVAMSDDDAMGAAFGTAQEVTDTGGTTNDIYVSSATSAITIGGSPAVGDIVFFRVYRKAANGSDTLAVNARLHGVKLLYTINTLDDT